ncbi:Uncharacterized protein SCF082_LOCUS45309 [Durusdinium trenchii]|uniref:Uncharacterized protein n=1 Tax=Durusdinium trenchii TaxID=1381693 RepID=A0ABP0RBD2_9DINO
MDLTIHIVAGGAASTIALSLDLLPHQITAMAHVSSILQMCSLYAQSRPSQVEAQQQLKTHMERLNYIQARVLRQQKQHALSRGRVMKPMPAILCSGHMGEDSEDIDSFEVQALQRDQDEPRAEAVHEDAAAEESDEEPLEPLVNPATQR